MSFSTKQFREALQDSAKLHQRIEKFIQSIKKAQIDVTYYTIEELYKIFQEKETPLVKVNALFALRMVLETCEYPAIEMTEAFLLPLIQDISLYQSDKRTYAKTSQYFKEKGYPGSIPNLQQLSHNFVTLATNLVFLADAIKHNLYFYTDKLTVLSGFGLLAKKLKQKKLEVPPQSQSKQWMNLYEQNLLKFGSTPQYEASYLDLFKAKVEKYLVEGGKARETLDFRKLLKNGDSWLTSEIFGCLHESLDDNNFQVRRLALGLLNDFVIGGDVEAIMIINQGQALQRIVERILQVKGSSDIGRGAQIYPEIAGQLQAKKNFYIDFLRCLENWARLIPTAIYLNQQEESKVSRMLKRLKDKQFIFPSNDLYAKFAKEFQQNMKRNEQRNNYIIRSLNEVQSERDKSLASNRLSKYSQKISLIKEMRQSTILTLPQIEKLIEDTEGALLALTLNERDVSKNMKAIRYFSQEFEKKFELIEQSVSESRLQNTYVKGLKCLEKIEEIGPYYQDYINGRIDFKKFSQSVTAKCDQINKSKSKVSDILSKLSKSKDMLSRSGLDLSRSINAIKQKEAFKPDYILEKSANLEQAISHNTKTITNMSNLEEDPLPSNQVVSRSSKIASKSSKLGQNNELAHKQPSKISSKPHQKSSISSSSQLSTKNKPIQKFQTAKFLGHDEYQLRPGKSKRSGIEESSNRQQSGTSHNNSSRPSAHFNQFKSPPSKRKQQFSEGSSWSSSDQKPKKLSNQKSSRGISSFQEALVSGSKEPNADKKSKTREIFSDSSFSKYDESNQQLRDVIDKSENPDFKMVFKQRQPSANSKTSKHTIQSHEHYVGVLESLAPKSIDNYERDISRFSKDKSTSQLPPRSQFDTSSKIDQRMNFTGASKFREKTIVQNQHQYHFQPSNSDHINKSQRQSVVSSSKSNVNSTSRQRNHDYKVNVTSSDRHKTANDNNSSRPKHQTSSYRGKSSIKANNSFQRDSQIHRNSIRVQNQYNIYYEISDTTKKDIEKEQRHSHVKQESSQLSRGHETRKSGSRGSRRSQYPMKSSGRVRFDKMQNQLMQQQDHIRLSQLNKQTVSGLQAMKEGKVKEIQELQKKIQSLRLQEKQLHLVRSEWQSPTRPQTLRTALSPRFRNNTIDYSQSTETFKRVGYQTSPKRRRLADRTHPEMNFQISDKFKPPEGRLIYRRLYKKDLNQLDNHEKKKILKGKQLVYRNDDIEVGMMINKNSRDLKIVYYVTPSLLLKTFIFKLESNPKILVHAIPGTLANLQPRKQYRIYLFAEIVQFPYKMPIIHFKYHPELLPLEENLFERNQVNYFTSIVPFFFLKFFITRSVNLDYMAQQWSKGSIVRGDEANYSRRVLPKHFYVLQYFPDLVNVYSSEYETTYGMQCQYGSTRFLLRITIKINRFFYIQGVLTSFRDRENSEKIMQFAIASMTALLEKSERILI